MPSIVVIARAHRKGSQPDLGGDRGLDHRHGQRGLVGIRDDHVVPLHPREEPQLRRAIVLEVGVPIEVIGRDVRDCSHTRAEIANPLQLIAADLGHQHLARAHCGRLGQGHLIEPAAADVPAENRVGPSGPQQEPSEGCGRALAVRSRDRHDRALCEPVGKLHLADHLATAPDHVADGRVLPSESRARHEKIELLRV